MSRVEHELPPGWRAAKLSEIADVRLGKMLSAKARDTSLSHRPYLRNENVRWGHIDLADVKTMGFKPTEFERYGVEVGDLLVCEGGEPGRAAVYTGPSGMFMYQKALHRVRVRRADVSAHYLAYFFERHAAHLKTSQTTIAHFPLEKMLELWVPLAPQPEQLRIVAEIEKQFTRLASGVAGLERLRAHLRRYRAAVLKAACAAGASAGAQLPAGWRWLPVSELAEVGTGATPLRSRKDFYAGGTVPWVTSSVVNEPFVKAPSEHVTSAALRETNLTVYPKHTLLVAMYGEGKTRGKVSELLIEAATNQALAALTVKSELIEYRPYLKYFLEGGYADMRRSSSGGVQPNLSLRLIKSIQVPIPPRDQVADIVAGIDSKLSGVDSVLACVDSAFRRSERLRASILRAAFDGRLVAPEQPARAPAA